MNNQRIEKLKQQYTGQWVIVDVERPELAQLLGKPGRVKTVDFNGRALVQFEGVDRSWHDVELDYLKVIDPPEPPKPRASPAPAEQPKPARAAPAAGAKLSRLELARLEKASGETAVKQDFEGGSA